MILPQGSGVYTFFCKKSITQFRPLPPRPDNYQIFPPDAVYVEKQGLVHLQR